MWLGLLATLENSRHAKALHRISAAALEVSGMTTDMPVQLPDSSAPARTAPARTTPARTAPVRLLRDPTRGGVATTLNEFTEQMPFSIELDETTLPVDPAVEAACDMLGLDPLYCACEGRMLAVCAPEAADAVLDAIKKVPGGENAARIGTVTEDMPGKVLLKTPIGGRRILAKLTGIQLPRIC